MSQTQTPSGILDQLVQRAQRLYSLPGVAVRVLEMTKGNQVDLGGLRECLELDPALSGKLLRVVNSSLFGLARKVSDLTQALGLLGVKPLKLLVLGFSLPEQLFCGVTAATLGRYWRHAVTKAVAARQLAETVWRTGADEAFLAGLLQDLGMLVLLQELGDPYVHFLDGIYREGGDLAALEMATLGFDHAVLSARLLEHWGLPETLVDAIGRPHDVERLSALTGGEATLAQILHLAELFARLLSGGQPHALAELLDAGQRYHKLSLSDIESISAALQEKVKSFSQVLSVALPPQADYREVLAAAHRQLSEVAAGAAEDLAVAPEPAEELLREAQDLTQAVQRFVSPRLTGQGGKIARGDAAVPRTAQESPAPLSPAGLAAHVTTAVAACRKARCPVSLAVVELDHFSEVVLTRGFEGATRIAMQVEDLLRTACQEVQSRCLRTSDARFALLLENHDRQAAGELVRQLLREIHTAGAADGQAPYTASGGLASIKLPPHNFPSQELIDAANRCLGAAKSSGGDVVKSIELC